MPYAAHPPHDPLTAEDIGPAVIIIVYSLASVSILVVAVRFALSRSRKISFGFDDGVYILANLWAIASSILWHRAVAAGLGKRIDAVSPGDLDKFYKFEYSAQIVEIVAMLCAKVAFALLVGRVTAREKSSKLMLRILAVLGAWAVFSLFALAFQCPLPRPWAFEPARCHAYAGLLYTIIALNALTDVGLAVWIIPPISKLRMGWGDRALVILLFGLRACILVPAAVEISMMHTFVGNNDQTRVTVNRVILSQITVYVSVITAALPRTNQFLSRLNSYHNQFVLPTPLRLVPPNGVTLSTTVYSGKQNDGQAEHAELSQGSINVRRDIVFKEKDKAAKRAEQSGVSTTQAVR